MELKINFKNSLQNYQAIFYIIMLSIIIEPFGLFPMPTYNFFFGISMFSLLLILWAIFVHIQYYRDGKNKIITITGQKIQVYTTKDESVKNYDFNEITQVLYVRAASIDPPFVFTHSVVEYFHFLRLYFVDGTSINITSLMKSDLTEVVNLFSEFEVIRVKRAHCFLNSNYQKYLNKTKYKYK